MFKMKKERKIMRRLFCDWHMPSFLENLDIDAEYFIGQAVKSGAQSLNFMCKSAFGNCLYPSEIEYVHPAVKKKGDIFGKVCKLAKERGLEFIAYYNMTLNDLLAADHPEWKQVDRNGNKLKSFGYHVFCMNNKLFRERAFRTIEEITRKYDIDGFYFDMQYFNPAGCFCPSCKEKFLANFGYELNPEAFKSVKNWLDFEEFQRLSRKDFILSARNKARNIKPELIFTWNHSGLMEESHIELDAEVDLLGSEAHPPHYSECMVKSKWMQLSGKPFGFCMPETIHSWGDWTLVNPETLKTMCGITMAHGGSIEINHVPMPDGSYKGRVFDGVYEVIGDTLSWLKEREEYCVKKESVPVTAVLHSIDNLRLKLAFDHLHGHHNKYSPSESRNIADYALGCENTSLATRLLSALHIPTDVLYNENTLGRLNEYELLMLPNTGYINDGLAEQVKAYVREGGCLLSTYSTSLLNEKGEMLKNFKLSDVFGVDFERVSDYSVNYIDRFTDGIGNGIPAHPILIKDAGYNENPVYKSLYCRLHNSAKAAAFFTEPAIETNLESGYHIYHDHSPAGKVTDIPAVIINRYGKGCSIFMPFPLLQTYKLYASPWLKALVKNSLVEIGIPGKVAIEASSNVQVVMTKDAVSWYLHLQNIAREADSILIDGKIPSGEVSCRLKTDLKIESVENVLSKEKITFKKNGDFTSFTIPSVKEHEIIRIKF